MTNREVALIVRDARSSGFVRSEDDFVPYILSRGVTQFEYDRYVVGRRMMLVTIGVMLGTATVLVVLFLTGRASA